MSNPELPSSATRKVCGFEMKGGEEKNKVTRESLLNNQSMNMNTALENSFEEITEPTTRPGKQQLSTTTTKRKIDFDLCSSESEDDEVFFDIQAHKRRKMGEANEEMKIWFAAKLGEELGRVATKDQMDCMIKDVRANSELSRSNKKMCAKNVEDIQRIGSSLDNIEREIMSERRTLHRERNNSSSFPPLVGSGKGSAPESSRRWLRTTTAITKPPSIPNCGSSSPSERERNAFLLARRSLQVLEIDGEDKEQMKKEFLNFCHCALGVAAEDDVGVVSIKRLKSAPRGKAYKEVLVEFSDNFARDDILMRGPRLASYRDEKGNPTSGIRLHIRGEYQVKCSRASSSYSFKDTVC